MRVILAQPRASVPAWCARSRSSSGRSRSSAPRSMCATRSCTTAMSSSGSSAWAPSSSRSWTRFPTAPSRSSAPMAWPNRSSTRRRRAACRCWMPPVRWCRRSIIQGKRYVARGRALILIGHAGHPEVEGTMGQVGAPVHLVSTVEDVARLDLPDDAPVAYVTQTTLSVDDTRGVIAALQARFSDLEGPDISDICYATQHRQSAVRELCEAVGPAAGGGQPQQLELQPAARDRRRAGPAEPPDRRRQRARSGMARAA